MEKNILENTIFFFGADLRHMWAEATLVFIHSVNSGISQKGFFSTVFILITDRKNKI